MEVIKPLTALGLMSGTSMDGVDAALLVTDGVDVFDFGKALNRPYDMEMRADLRSITGKGAQADAEKVKDIERRLTLFHADVAKELMDSAGLRAQDVDVIGFHGQTVYHNAAEHVSVQIGVDRRKRRTDCVRHGARKRARRRLDDEKARFDHGLRRVDGGNGIG